MGDDNQCAFEKLELLFKPFDSGDIKMVCWLIEKQDIGLRDQRACKGNPTAPSPREVSYGDVRGEGKLRNDTFDPLLYLPATLIFERSLYPRKFIKARGVGSFKQVMVARQKLAHILQSARNRLIDGLVVGDRQLLFQSR